MSRTLHNVVHVDMWTRFRVVAIQVALFAAKNLMQVCLTYLVKLECMETQITSPTTNIKKKMLYYVTNKTLPTQETIHKQKQTQYGIHKHPRLEHQDAANTDDNSEKHISPAPVYSIGTIYNFKCHHRSDTSCFASHKHSIFSWLCTRSFIGPKCIVFKSISQT